MTESPPLCRDGRTWAIHGPSLVGPLSGSLIISLFVILIAAQSKQLIHASEVSLATLIMTWWERLWDLHVGDLWDQRVVGIGVCQQGADRQ